MINQIRFGRLKKRGVNMFIESTVDTFTNSSGKIQLDFNSIYK